MLASLGLFLYLWPALREPIVLWADGRTDLDWAREGIGLWKPLHISAGDTPHALKPGYLLFLRLATALLPGIEEARAVLVVQCLFVWAALVGTGLAIGRRAGWAVGMAAYVVLLLFLPLRIAASNVQPEAIAPALVLALVFGVGFADESPNPARVLVAVLLWTVLFWIRPNAAGIVGAVLGARWIIRRQRQALATFVGVALVCLIGTWLATRPVAGPDAARSFPDALLFGSAEYAWMPSLGGWLAVSTPASAETRMQRVALNWNKLLHSTAPDRNRELAWRAFHGILGVEYYDSRWSPGWRRFHQVGRVLTPFLVLAAFAALLTTRNLEARWLGWVLLASLVAENLAIGSGPRYAVPILPVVLSMGTVEVLGPRPSSRRFRALALTGAFVALLAAFPAPASWEWGVIGTSGVVLEQRIPKSALPSETPAVLHVRIAPEEPWMEAGLDIEIDGRRVYRSARGENRSRIVLSIRLPAEALATNAERPVVLRLISRERFGPQNFLLFPVIPAPWRSGSRRVDSRELSPASDIAKGGLDWWAHAGVD